MLPSSFECIACGLKIAGFSKLLACRLGNRFTARTISSAAEFFNLHTDEELEEALRLRNRTSKTTTTNSNLMIDLLLGGGEVHVF